MRTFCLFIFTVVLTAGLLAENVRVLVWRAEQRVVYYSSYASVTPSRFSLPHGLGEARWNFRATKSPSSCDDEMISTYLKYGSLPAVSPLDEEFPENFYLGSREPTHLTLKPNNVSLLYSVHFPQGGDWYVIALIPDTNTHITQKGLTADCKYQFSASLEVVDPPPHVGLTLDRPTELSVPHNSSGDGVWVGFTVPPESLAVELQASHCSLAPCHLQLSLWDHVTGEFIHTNCTDVSNGSCSLRLPSPLLGVTYLAKIQLMFSDNATLEIAVVSEDCTSDNTPTTDDDVNPPSCLLMPRLDRYQESYDFSTQFVSMHNTTVEKNTYLVSNMTATIVPFFTERTTDIGGTLRVQVSFNKKEVTSKGQNVQVCAMLLHNQFPPLMDDPDFDLCDNYTNGFQANSTSEADKEGQVFGGLYVPYPQEGVWLVAMTMHCLETGNGSASTVACQNGTVNITVTANVHSCVDGDCSGNGDCNSYLLSSDFIVFSSCDCTAGWRGYGCTDGHEAKSDTSQLIELLLLTLSNIFFVPAIVLALYRRYYLEAIVYFYNMFFSTFYHACDGNRVDKYVFCMTKYSVLAVSDFWASTISLWVTLVAMAQFPLNVNSTIQMAAPLALIIGVLLDRHSLWVIMVPAGLGLLVTVVSWVTRCCHNHKCFPSKRRYLCMLPGVVIAAAGAVIFALFETDANYKYTHSAWHMALSLSIIFLLPPRRPNKAKTSFNFDETESTEGLMLGPNSYCRRLNFDL